MNKKYGLWFAAAKDWGNNSSAQAGEGFLPRGKTFVLAFDSAAEAEAHKWGTSVVKVIGPNWEPLDVDSKIVGHSTTGLPTVEALARAIFDTDERVRKDVSQYAGELKHTVLGPNSYVASRYMAPYFDKAWATNRGGWRSEAETRATQILGALKVERA